MDVAAGCLLVVLGPVLAWVSAIVIYSRIPKAIRNRKIGRFQSPRSSFHWDTFGELLRAYGREHGRDPWIITFLASFIWTLVLIVALLLMNHERDVSRWAGSALLAFIWFRTVRFIWQRTKAK